MGTYPPGRELMVVYHRARSLVHFFSQFWSTHFWRIGRGKFVDDTTALEIIPRCSPSLMPMAVNEICNFSSNRGMELNPKKCKELMVSFLKYKLPCNPIYISGVPVELVSSFKLFGVLLSEYLTWNTHADYVIKKANSRLYALRQLKKAGLSESDLIVVYCSFVRSRIEYASPTWSNMSSTLSDSLESIQKRALRMIYPDISYSDALAATALETMSYRWHKSCEKFINKLRSDEPSNNPLINIIKVMPRHVDHDYFLRLQRPNTISTNTERLVLTVKYYCCIKFIY